MKGGLASFSLVTVAVLPLPVQKAPASVIASAFKLPDPEKPVAAWRDTKKVSGPIATTPELLAQPARTAAAQIKRILLKTYLNSASKRAVSLAGV